MNLKEKNRKSNQQEQGNAWVKENSVNWGSNQVNMFKKVTNQIASQTFEAGELRGHRKSKNSNMIKQDFDESLQQPQYNCYGTEENEKNNRNSRNSYSSQRSNHSGGMLNSNGIENNYNGSLYDSRLQEAISEQVFSQFSKKYQKQMDGLKSMVEDYINHKFTRLNNKLKQEQRQNLQNVINQINISLSTTSKKQKILQSGLIDNQQKINILQKQINQFSVQIQEKMEKVLNSNSNNDVATSIKRSFGRNVQNANYLVQLKSSIKEIPIMTNPLSEQIKTQIVDLQQSIKSLKIDFSNIKQQLKNKETTFAPNQKNNETTDSTNFNLINQQLNKLRSQICAIDTQCQNKLKEHKEILVCHDENLQGINDQMSKVINTQILPRMKKIQEQCQPQAIEKQMEYLKKQTIKQLESMPIIRIRSISQEEKNKIQKMKNLPKSQQFAYMLDENHQILDTFGNFLVDQNNQRIKLEEEQIYYLQQIEGIQIKLPALQAR